MTKTNSAGSRLRARIRHTILLLLFLAAPAAAQSEAPRDDPFARRAWTVQLSGHGAIETWNYNISREEMWGIVPGFSYGLGKGVTLTAAYPLYYVDQRGVDAWIIAATIGVRSRVYRRGRMSVFWEFEVGVSNADTFTPPRGTRFNYLALGGGGATIRLRPRTHLMTGLRWIHLSNNGLAGRHRNPDIEAVGLHAGLLIEF